MKSQILAAIGESESQPAAALNAALAANDRVKYFFPCCRWPWITPGLPDPLATSTPAALTGYRQS